MTGSLLSVLLIGLTAALVLAQDDHAGHDHAGHDHDGHDDDHGEDAAAHPWEWAGTFDFSSATSYQFIASVVTKDAKTGKGGTYLDDSAVMLILPSSGFAKDDIEAAEPTAEDMFNVSSAPDCNGVIPVGSQCKLNFDSLTATKAWKIGPIMTTGAHVIFFQHHPIEFEGFAGHYLKDKNGRNIEPVTEEPPVAAAATKKKTSDHAGEAIGAAVLVTLCALIGLVLIVPFIKQIKKGGLEMITNLTTFSSIFAAGALLSATHFLILPESLHALGAAYPKDEVRGILSVGVSTLAGLYLGGLISMLCQLLKGSLGDAKPPPAAPTNTDAESGTAVVTSLEITPRNAEANEFDAFMPRSFCECKISNWTASAWSILVGDFVHNFVDGIAIGVAFRNCDPSFGWVVATGAIAHEVSQEVADFLVLITRGRMSIGVALTANLLSGVSCIIGAIITSYSEMDKESQGALLAFSGGVYTWVAVGECFGPLAGRTVTMKSIVYKSIAFCIGCVCISLVLLNHQHCEAPILEEAEVDPHAGHNH